MATGWELLGNALGGNSEEAYQEGRATGAQTSAALALARQRVDENANREKLAQSFEAIGIPATEAGAYAEIARSGINLGDVLGGRAKQQELGFRATAGSDDPSVDAGARNRALFGVASGPVGQFDAVGPKGYQDLLNPAAGVIPLGDQFADAGGGDAAGIQYLRTFGEIDPTTGQVRPENRRRAFDLLRTTGQTVNAGGVPYTLDFNPYTGSPGPAPVVPPAGPAVAPAATPATTPGSPAAQAVSTTETAANAEAVARAGKIGSESGQAAMDLPTVVARTTNAVRQADFVGGLVDQAITDVSGWTAGPGGTILGSIWGTPAYDTKSAIAVIKSNEGFRGLSQMRHESPTGGALGQVAVLELTFLQMAMGNLDQAQSPEQLKQMLGNIQSQYKLFRQAALDDLTAAQAKARGDIATMQALADKAAQRLASFNAATGAPLPGASPAGNAALQVGQSAQVGGFKVTRKQ